jgi:hypothetical protein
VLDEYDRVTRPLQQKLIEIGEGDPEALQALDRLRAAALYRMAVCTLGLGGTQAVAHAADLRIRAERLVPEIADEVGRESASRPTRRP